ncbi:ABC transporter permease [Halomonas sp. HMF6819]|uniref:ABC transporter permease n=1 Tax=Halomonas sp. HMF6819 TaxID=3373085 RepID=UPI00379F9CBD
MLGLLHGTWSYRQFIIDSIRNDFANRFARSRWGFVWMVAQPLAMVLVYALILSEILAARLPGIENQYAYAIYLSAGFLVWTLFFELLTRTLTLFIDNANLIKKMRFPRIALPLIVVGTGIINNGILFVAILGVFAALGHLGGSELLWIFPMTLLTALLALGFGLILGVLNVFIRDVGQFVTIVLQFWFWLTPIVYPLVIVPEEYRYLLQYNPLFPIVNAYQNILVYGQSPDLATLIPIALLAIGLLVVGLLLFRKASPEMTDAL